MASEIERLSKVEQRLNDLERLSRQNDQKGSNFLHPEYRHQNTNIFYKALRFIYPMEGIVARAT